MAKNAHSIEPEALPNVAVVLAAGRGSRMHAALPKALLSLAGRTLMERAVRAFAGHPLIDEVCLVVSADTEPAARALMASGELPGLRRVVRGGRERSDSTRAALQAYAGRACNLLIHDAARPLVSEALIDRVCRALVEHEAVAVAVPAVDTVYRVQGDRLVAIPPRAELRCAQTPQAFRRELLERAYRLAAADAAFRPTDDCSVVATYAPEVPITIVEGEARNMKITYPADLAIALRYLEAGQP